MQDIDKPFTKDINTRYKICSQTCVDSKVQIVILMESLKKLRKNANISPKNPLSTNESTGLVLQKITDRIAYNGRLTFKANFNQKRKFQCRTLKNFDYVFL